MTPFQVYAFCEGVWSSPPWFIGVDLGSKIDRYRLACESCWNLGTAQRPLAFVIRLVDGFPRRQQTCERCLRKAAA